MSTWIFRASNHPFTEVLHPGWSAIGTFSTKAVLLSGHNKWSKIKHDKAKEDAGKSKQRSALVQEIRTIAKLHGADPNTNSRLAALVAIAKKSGLPKITLEGAIARGAGKSLSGANLEAVSIEAMMPASIATIIECQTDNKLRTLSDIRYIIKDFGGTVTPTNHLFERLGQIKVERTDGVREEDVFDQAIECGATDVEVAEDGNLVIYTEPQQTASVAETLVKTPGLQVTGSDIIWLPKAETKVENTLDGALDEFVDKLEEDPSVQSVYLNID